MSLAGSTPYYAFQPCPALSLDKTFSCGQCFRWHQLEDQSYIGVAFGRVCKIWMRQEALCLTCSQDEFETIWRPYFDLDLDYSAITLHFPSDELFHQAVAFGEGLRILAQDPWETLCTFIISQCNNIPRIKLIIESLCQAYGDPLTFESQTFYAFPAPAQLAVLSPDQLSRIRAGYRTPYLIQAAQAVACGAIDFDKLRQMPTQLARQTIMTLPGVGKKVADCFLLFGLHKLDAFPVDTWMNKVLSHYPDDFSSQHFGQFAGIAQQYLFYYARSIKLGK